MSENKEYNLHRTQVAPETKTQIKQILQGKKWAISLSGGGVRSVAHLGVLQAFEETGLKPTALSGCSSGALVAALYAAGQKPNDILNKVKTIKWWKLIKLSNPFNGILLTDSFVKPFLKELPQTFEALEKPLFINTMDLAQGETLVFSQGELLPILKASMALPIICKPVFWQNKQLFDGGLLNNLPIEPLLNKYDRIVGVHTNFIGSSKKTEISGIRNIMERTLQLSIAQSAGGKKELCDAWIEPKEVGNYSVFDFKNTDEIYNIAYEYTRNRLQEE